VRKLKQTDTKKDAFKYRYAGPNSYDVLDGMREPEHKDARKGYIKDLREKDFVIFSPRPIDFERFDELLEKHPDVRQWIENEPDPVLVSEWLACSFPEIFYTIEHVFEVYTDWKMRWTKKRPGGFIGGDPLQIPPILFDALGSNEIESLARRWFRKEIRALNNDPWKAIKRVDASVKQEADPKRRAFLAHVAITMRTFMSLKFPAFVEELEGGKPFPSAHVRLWVQRLKARDNVLIVGDVGTQKTSASIIGMEELGCDVVVIIARSYAKEMWAEEIRKYYRASQDPYVIPGMKDLDLLENMKRAKILGHRFFIVGYGNMRTSQEVDIEGEAYGDRLTEALLRLKPTGIIIDEAHAIKGKGTGAQRVMQVAQSETVKHRVMLTATPFENRPNEVANLACLLAPEEYPNPEMFLAKCKNNPRVYFAMMAGRMCDYFTQEDVLDLPPTNLTPDDYFPLLRIPCPPDMRRLQDRILNDGECEAKNQVNRLIQCLAIPSVAKRWYPELRKLPCIKDARANPKLIAIRQDIERLIRTGKVVIASGIFAGGITQGLKDGGEELHAAALLESWFPGKVLSIDGSSGAAGRIAIQEAWQTNPDIRILVASVRATAESLNFTLKRVPGSIEKVTVFYLSLPWKPTQYLQFNGRFRRPGCEVPIDVYTLFLEGTADENILELNQKKWRNSLIGVHGMQLFPEEEEALERSCFKRILDTPGRWLTHVFGRMLGRGELVNAKLLDGNIFDLPVAETMARYYLQVEDVSTSGQISRVVAPTLRRWRETGVIPSWDALLDVGCGPLILERKLDAPLHAVDLNPWMIKIGREHSAYGGQNAIEGAASRLPKEWSNRFSFVMLSLVLDLTTTRDGGNKLAPERVRVLQQMHRVLQTGGLLWCTFQARCFDESSFEAFVQAIKPFGFEPVDPWCNRIEATDHKYHPFTFWSLLLRKRSELRDTKPACPHFIHELPRGEGQPGRAKKRVQPKPPELSPVPVKGIRHEQFVIQDKNGDSIDLETALRTIKPASIEVEGTTIVDEYEIHPDEEAQLLLLHEMIRKRCRLRLGGRLSETLATMLFQKRPKSLVDLEALWRSFRRHKGAPSITFRNLGSDIRTFFKKEKTA